MTTEIITILRNAIFNIHCYSFSHFNCVAMMTVELGRRYFPHCSEVLDKFMDDDLPDLFYLEGGTQAEKEMKEMRFVELKKDVRKAFNKDKAEQSRLSSSSSSSSKKDGVNCKLRKLWWPVKYILNNCAYCMHIFERNLFESQPVLAHFLYNSIRAKTLLYTTPVAILSKENLLILLTAYRKMFFSFLWETLI